MQIPVLERGILMTHIIEHGFSLFTDAEIEVGLRHAATNDRVTLDYGRLRRLSNDAGKTRINAGEAKMTPRMAATRALQHFEREFRGSRMTERVFEAYVHAIAKMMSERSPRTRAKRRRDAEVAEILALSYKIDETPDIDPEVNRQLSLKLTGSLFEEHADAP